MTTPIVKTAKKTDEDDAIETLKLAFAADPAVRWIWPDPRKYLSYFPSFAKAFGGRAFENDSAHYIGNYSGVALWLPPSISPDIDQLMALLQTSCSDEAKNDIFEILEKMSIYHPHEPHWYLPLLGVDPFHHGKGMGSILLRHALIICDRQKKYAYLESSNAKNISLYERHGFKLLGTIQINNSPSIFPMLRNPSPKD